MASSRTSTPAPVPIQILDPIFALILLFVATGLPAQTQTTFEALTPTGVFVQVDNGVVSLNTSPAKALVTLRDPIAVRDEKVVAGTGPVVHARTKASMELRDQLPAVRIYEAGYASKLLSTMKSRRSGTTASTTSQTFKPGAHSWLLKVKDRPGRRLRLQVRMRSSLAGGGTQGGALVDIGNDGTVEFNRTLDNKRYVVSHPLVLDAGGNATIKIQTEVLLSSAAQTALSYAVMLDVSLEPLGDASATFMTYGSSCGPRIVPATWVEKGQRRIVTALDQAPANAPAILGIGVKRVSVQFPGSSCYLLTDPLILLGFRSNSMGKYLHHFPPIPMDVGVSATLQYAAADGGRLLTTEGAEFQTEVASGEPYDYFSLNHILSTGQSLSTGSSGNPALSTTQPYQNKMFQAFVCAGGGSTVVPLVEASVETHHSGMANLITKLAEDQVFKGLPKPRDTHEMLVSCHGAGGRPYSQLKKGTYPFSKGLGQVSAAMAIAKASKRSYVVRAVTNVHGETDHVITNTSYDQNLVQWQSDYEEDVRLMTGQTHSIPMLHTQMSSWTGYQSTTSLIPLLQLKASFENPRKIVMVGPKYNFSYASDKVHLVNTSYRHMGEYYAKVYRFVVLEGGTWEPLRPLVATRSGSVILLRFHVPVPPLVLDTTLVIDPGHHGFEFWDDSGSVAGIQSVELEDEDTVRITLTKVPTGKTQFVRYAYTGISGAKSGPSTGARGNLRDSDDTPSRHGNKLYNWAVHFEQVVQ